MPDTPLSDVSDDMLMALADNELDSATAASLEARIHADPALAARYDVFAESAEALRAAFAPGPVPDRLLAAILEAPEPQTERQPEPRASAAILPLRPTARPLWQPAALAAGLVIAAGLAGYGFGSHTPSGPPADTPGVLASIPAGETRVLAGANWRALGSYDTDAGLCRLLARETATSATRRIICEEPQGWALALEVSTGSGHGYIPASDPLVELTDHMLDTLGAGPALEPAEEARRLPAPQR